MGLLIGSLVNWGHSFYGFACFLPGGLLPALDYQGRFYVVSDFHFDMDAGSVNTLISDAISLTGKLKKSTP